MHSNGLGNLTSALGDLGTVVASIGDGFWAAPTPCGDWSVRQLTSHLVSGNLLFAAILSGRPMPPPTELRRRTAEDTLGDDASTAFRSAAQALLAAFELPGVLDQVHVFPVGPLPGRAAIHVRTVEALVHGWDLATATGLRLAASADVVADGVLDFSRELLARIPEGRHPFGPSVAVDDSAPALDRLVALLGRDPAMGHTGGRAS
jgi:uncharacterized protein (TIGR03086 family)